MQRVLVIGSPGAGKSTFSQRFAARTGLPLTHLDDEYWLPGWVRPQQTVWEARIRELIAAERWILDGNYTSTVLLRASRADTVIVLAYPRLLCLFRAVRRALFNQRADAKALGREPLDLEFLRFIWTFPEVQRRQLAELKSVAGLTVVQLTSDAQAQAWLAQMLSA
ncbi:DNA topology modulation protein FlaR [Deinococcus sp. KNUC1210]|uniref:DNA topology modulation protein FlaR n=1 Tax=Deinococcus sp. KNUC1210 TaxID=2917691 RepID=UPI001EF0616A|nr:DNA topology modulation protein FlaR [Deinococcus sp. KNUC1210]ULH15246.1 DNA topology modulation protein FlaR [Deinococcus sp. KNUC1210]